MALDLAVVAFSRPSRQSLAAITIPRILYGVTNKINNAVEPTDLVGYFLTARSASARAEEEAKKSHCQRLCPCNTGQYQTAIRWPGSQEDEDGRLLPLIVCVQAAHRVNNSPVALYRVEKLDLFFLSLRVGRSCVSLYFVISVLRPPTDGLMFHHGLCILIP